MNERPVNYCGVVVLANAGDKPIASHISGVKAVQQQSVDFVKIGALTDPRPITAVQPDVLLLDKRRPNMTTTTAV